MSVQIALMAGMAALSATQAVSSMAKGADAASAAEASGLQGAMVRGSGARAAAAGTGVEIAETRLSTAQQEIQRRMQIAQLWQSNAIDAVARGAAPDAHDSTGAIQAYNARLGEADIANIRFMGDSRVSKLSFRQEQQQLGVQASELEALNISENAARTKDALMTNMMFQIGGAALKGASNISYASGPSGGYTTNADMLKTDAEIRDWSSYGSR
jgi:hypothetical protein